MDTYIVKVPVSGKMEIVPFNKADSLKQLQEAVGGDIEAAVIPSVPTNEPYSICCFVDEEGLLKHLPRNHRISGFAKSVYHLPIVGDAVFVAYDAEGETVGLTKEDADKIVELLTNEG